MQAFLGLEEDPRMLRRRLPAGTVPALLLGGINLLRALGMAGIPAIVAATRRSETEASRWCAGRCRLPPLKRRESAAQTLAVAGERLLDAFGARPPVFYGSDEALMLLHEQRAELEPTLALLLNDRPVAEALIDKRRFQAFAETRGIAVPRLLRWEELARARGPVIAKPASKAGWEEARLLRSLFGPTAKARIYAHGAAALADPLARRLADALIFQEYVPGDDRALWSCHGFADEEGRLLEWFIGRKIRTCPALCGESSYLALEANAALEREAQALVRLIPLKGVFKIDFKRHAESGRLHVLEVNARYSLWHYLGAANGVNLPRVAYDHLVHGRQPARHSQPRGNVRWLALGLDYRAFRDASAGGRMTAAQWLASLLEAPKVYQRFAWNDPAPFLYYYVRRYRGVPLRMLIRLRNRWLSTAS